MNHLDGCAVSIASHSLTDLDTVVDTVFIVGIGNFLAWRFFSANRFMR
ncbi:MAG: hypothetical protein LBB80_00085 [Treponema sp.]|nr:hypothetical protein [Treponema sp.]